MRDRARLAKELEVALEDPDEVSLVIYSSTTQKSKQKSNLLLLTQINRALR